MVPHERIKPGYWYVKNNDSFEIVEVSQEYDNEIMVWHFGNSNGSSVKSYEFICPVPEPYLGKWDYVNQV